MSGIETFVIVFGTLACGMIFGKDDKKSKPVKSPMKIRSKRSIAPQYTGYTPPKRWELNTHVPKIMPPTMSATKRDAISGLRALGFDKETATERITPLSDTMKLEDMIKRGLA